MLKAVETMMDTFDFCGDVYNGYYRLFMQILSERIKILKTEAYSRYLVAASVRSVGFVV